jgi:hypothetical protein
MYKLKFFLFIPCILLLLTVATLATSQGGTSVDNGQNLGNAAGWQIQTIATRGNTGRYTDLALDANGYPHVTFVEYVKRTNGLHERLMYAYWDGVSWHTDVVDAAAAIAGSQATVSLVLDSNDVPHIAYLASAPSSFPDLRYAYWNGDDEEWEIQTLDSENVKQHVSLALDSGDQPHISYARGVAISSSLIYTFWDGVAWQVEMVDGGEFAQVGKFNSLALDASDHRHISYTDEANDTLKYAYHDGASWSIQTVENASFTYLSTSLAVTAAGVPHISYSTFWGDLKYAHWNGANWQIETPDSPGPVLYQSSLALDAAGNPHIVYAGFGFADSVPLAHIYWDGADWQGQTLDPGGGRLGRYNALALDEAGNVHASYYDETHGDLRYVTWAADWLTWTVEAPANIRATSIQVLGVTGEALPYIGYYNQTTGQVSLANWDGDWNLNSLDPVTNPVTQLSLATSLSRPHLSYYDADNQRLMYATWNGLVWSYREIDTGNNVGRYNQILLVGGNDATVRIAYWDGTAHQVKLARLDAGILEIYTNTAGPALDANSGYLSAAVLPGTKIGISYYDGIRGDLRLAVWDPATESWTDELVDGIEGYAGQPNALQMDGTTGSPVIAYYHASANSIYLARQELGSWQFELAVNNVGAVTSLSLELGLNSYLRPRIAYTTQVGDALYVASKQEGNWEVDTVVTGSVAVNHASLALDDRPHLAYTDNGLYYAFRSATLDVDTAVPGSPPLRFGEGYNPLDACLAVLNLFSPDELVASRPFTPPAAIPLGQAESLTDPAIFGGMNTLFAASPGGEYYIDLYRDHGSEMGQIGLDDPQLLWYAYGTLQNFLPGLEALVTGQGGNILVTQEMVDDALDIWQRVAAAGSPEVAATINAELARYNNLQDFVGLTFNEWAIAIGVNPPSHQTYLPLVNHTAGQ